MQKAAFATERLHAHLLGLTSGPPVTAGPFLLARGEGRSSYLLLVGGCLYWQPRAEAYSRMVKLFQLMLGIRTWGALWAKQQLCGCSFFCF